MVGNAMNGIKKLTISTASIQEAGERIKKENEQNLTYMDFEEINFDIELIG